MTIQEVLEADWNVDKLDISVCHEKTGWRIMRYCIGRDVWPSKQDRFIRETEAGSLYGEGGLNVLYCNRVIQFLQCTDKPKGLQLCAREVLLKQIPKELLELAVYSMSPWSCGGADFLHGYRFTCYVDSWNGISGEKENWHEKRIDWAYHKNVI